MPNITKNIVSVGLLLKDGAGMETNIGIMNFKYKGTRMKFTRPAKYGIYYLHASKINHKPGMTEIIYEINDDKIQKGVEEEKGKKGG